MDDPWGHAKRNKFVTKRPSSQNQRVKRWLLRAGGRGEEKFLLNGYGVLVLQDGKVLEICYTAIWLYLTVHINGWNGKLMLYIFYFFTIKIIFTH